LHLFINGSTFDRTKSESLQQEKSKNNFGIAFFFALAMVIAAGILVLVLGKKESFLLINGYHNDYLDLFFKYFTHAGDGWMWVPLGLFCIFFKRKYIIAVVAGIIISTLLAQFLKRVVFPDELRPIAYLADNFSIHQVDGVSMLRTLSFPSGHTTSAFTMVLILAHMINKKSWSVMLPLLALLAGYSRIYLGQHFLTDVLAGMCIGILSAVLSLMIYKSILKSLNKKPAADTINEN